LGRLSCADNIKHILSQKKINIRRLIRMAGDIDTFIGNLNKPQAQRIAGECVRSLLDKLRIRELLIVGIDLAWDQSILSALPSHLETVWFINEDEHVKYQFIAKCGNVKNFHYLTGPKGSYELFFKLLYWNINQGITQSHQLIEDVNNNLHNLRIELNTLKKRNEEKDAIVMENMESMRSKMESIMQLLEEIREK
jgi:hypothetical protein